jgi:hypothetical protein
VARVRLFAAWTTWATNMPSKKGSASKSVVRNAGSDTIKTTRKVATKARGGAIKQFSPIARPQRFEGVF